MPKYEVCTINRQYVRDWLRQNSLKATEASGMLGKNRNYVTNILCRADEGVTETVIDQLCSLGMSKVALLNPNSTVETSSGKVLEKPTVDEEEIKKKLFQQKPVDRDPAVEKAARAVDENGERLPFEKRMELLKGTDELTRVYRARDEERKELMECLREQDDGPAADIHTAPTKETLGRSAYNRLCIRVGKAKKLVDRLKEQGATADEIELADRYLAFAMDADNSPSACERFVIDNHIDELVVKYQDTIEKKEETRYKAAFKQLVSDIMDIFAADPANFNMSILNSIKLVSKTYNVRLL